jgi:hypothetical protein
MNYRVFTLDSGISYEMNGDEPPEIPEGGVAGGSAGLGGDKQAIAARIVAKGRHSYLGDVRPKIEDIANGANADAIPCGLNINILRIIDAITDKHTIKISDLNRHCTDEVPGGSSTRSRHYAGNGSAIDIAVIDGVATSGRDANAHSVIAISMPILSSAAISAGSYSNVGQVQCGPAPNFLPSVGTFEDGCHHVHMDVPAWSDPALQYTPGGW